MINVLNAEARDRIVATIPMRRLGDPRNVELAVRFLVDADYITGATININGGLL
jgi:3-oxoacyl-[acyl-carrier protein] reductase